MGLAVKVVVGCDYYDHTRSGAAGICKRTTETVAHVEIDTGNIDVLPELVPGWRVVGSGSVKYFCPDHIEWATKQGYLRKEKP